MNRSGKTFVATAVIVVGFVAATLLTRAVETTRPPMPAGYEDEDLALQGTRLRGFAFGAEGLLADWYWMNSLQYMGKKISATGLSNLNLDDLTPLNPRLLYPYLNNATDLDPTFIAPYLYGATILPAIDSQHAIALTEKGIANNPDMWRLHQYLGYIYWRRGDYDKASEVYAEGGRIPGSPVFLRMMAARMKAEGNSRELARDMYRQLAADAQDDVSRESAELRLLQIDSLDERDVINPVMRSYLEANGKCIDRWQQILPQLANKKTAQGTALRIDNANNIVDPSGTPYLIDPKKCEAAINGAVSRVPAV